MPYCTAYLVQGSAVSAACVGLLPFMLIEQYWRCAS